MDIFYSAIGAGIGGFIGVMAFYFVKWRIEINRAKRIFIAEYLCANDLNRGQITESEGELMHHHGRRISDSEELKLFDAKNPIWEWTDTEVGKDRGASIIYGPYTTDFDEPGIYSVTFIMKGIGLVQPEDKINDHILLELDVNASTPDYAMKPMGDLINFRSQNKFSRGYVRISHLANEGWTDFILKFYSDAKGIWEYRILPYDGSENRPNNLKLINPSARIVFDKIVIHKVPKFQSPSI